MQRDWIHWVMRRARTNCRRMNHGLIRTSHRPSLSRAMPGHIYLFCPPFAVAGDLGIVCFILLRREN